jgi:hypothetical protein
MCKDSEKKLIVYKKLKWNSTELEISIYLIIQWILFPTIDSM